jgi:hypothetical protein
MLGNVFQQLYTVVDTMVVGKGVGMNALAALGSSDWFNWMLLSMVQGFAQGFAIPMAQAFGADDRNDDVFAVTQAGMTSVHHDPSPPFPVSPIILLIYCWIVNMKTSFKLKKNCEHTVTREF